MANITLVSSSVRDVNEMPTAVDTIARSTVKSSRKQTPFTSKQETNVSGLEGYRKSLEMEGFQVIHPHLYPSEEDQVLLQVTNGPGISRLAGVLGKKIDPFCAPLSKIVNYLSTLFDEGLQYQTTNAHWSGISANHNFLLSIIFLFFIFIYRMVQEKTSIT